MEKTFSFINGKSHIQLVKQRIAFVFICVYPFVYV